MVPFLSSSKSAQPQGLEYLPLVSREWRNGAQFQLLRLMDKILHDPKDPKLWELWYIPYNG